MLERTASDKWETNVERSCVCRILRVLDLESRTWKQRIKISSSIVVDEDVLRRLHVDVDPLVRWGFLHWLSNLTSLREYLTCIARETEVAVHITRCTDDKPRGIRGYSSFLHRCNSISYRDKLSLLHHHLFHNTFLASTYRKNDHQILIYYT